MDRISVIVPCYNEEEALPLFYEELLKAADKMKPAVMEIILVDDGSSDGTLTIIKRLEKADPAVRYIAFSRNFGKEAAMYAGLCESSGDFCVIMDADLQHPPALLPEMYRVLKEEDCDYCGGKRVGRKGDGSLRELFTRMFYKIGKWLTGMDMRDGYGDFRMMKRVVADSIINMGEYSSRYMKGIFSFVGFETKWIKYEDAERVKGTSKWKMGSLFAYAADGIMAFSTLPLRLAGLASVLLFAAAIVFMTVCAVNCAGPSKDIRATDVLLLVVMMVSSMQMLFIMPHTFAAAATDISVGKTASGDWHEKFADKFTDTVVSTDTSYTSPDLSVKLTYNSFDTNRLDRSGGGVHEAYGTRTAYVLADIYVSDISCIKTAFAEDTYGTGFSETLRGMSKRMKSVLAVNGDSYSNNLQRDNGVIIRNGTLYRSNSSDTETCILYRDGTMEIHEPGPMDGQKLIDEGGVPELDIRAESAG